MSLIRPGKIWAPCTLWIILCLGSQGRASMPDYLWPTNASTYLTSSFAEYRTHRFHGGIDVKTWGEVGFKVFAVRPGYVSRVELSPYGYGRCLFLKLDSGETALYGHLQKFSEALESYVREKQEEAASWSIELDFEKEQFPVAQGDVVAYTGQSGVGAPHLHFELLDPDGRPFNPLHKGYPVTDTIAPTIRQVMIVPLEAHSRVNGDLVPLLLAPRRLAPGRFVIDQPVQVIGRIAFAIHVVDEMDGVHNKFGVYHNRLVIDGEEVFHARYDSFPYELNHHSNLDRDYRALVRGQGYFQRLFRDFGNGLPFYGGKEAFYGVLECAPAESDRDWLRGLAYALGIFWDLPGSVRVLDAGEHAFEIETSDFAGNKASVRGRLLAAAAVAKPVPALPASAKTDRFEIAFDYFDTYARVMVHAPAAQNDPFAMRAIYADGYQEELVLQQRHGDRYLAGLRLYSHHAGPVRLQILQEREGRRAVLHEAQANYVTVRGSKAKTVATADGLCQIDFSEKSLFRSIFVRAQTLEADAVNPPPLSKLYEIAPTDVPLKHSITVRLRHPSQETQRRQLAVYALQSTGKFDFVGNEMDENSAFISGRTRTLGTFCLLRDSEPPAVAIISPASTAPLRERRPVLKARISDELSGLGGESCWSMELDGRKVIAEYDYEAKMVFHRPVRALAAGRHHLVVRVRDRCGNETRQERFFVIH